MWTTQVVGTLCDLKRDGLSFEAAWANAMLTHPPRGRDLGEWRPTLIPQPGAEESVVDFFRRVAEDAWLDRHPSLRHFSADSMRDVMLDGVNGRGRSREAQYAA